MNKKDSILLVRIDERVKTIFNEMDEMKRKMKESNKKQYHIQTEILPKMMSEIKLLKARPLGVSGWVFALLRRII